MNKLYLSKPNINNLYIYIYTGFFLIFISILDVVFNSFFEINLTTFLPTTLSFTLPLIIGFLGLYLVRIEFTGIKYLDQLNKNIKYQ